MTPYRLHAVATIRTRYLDMHRSTGILKQYDFFFIISFEECEKYLKFFYVNSGSLQRPVAYSSQLITFCGGCFICDAHDFKTCFWIKFLLMRRYITIEENLYEESYFIMWCKIIKKSFREHIHDRSLNYRILLRLLSSRPLLYVQFSNSGESFLTHFHHNLSNIVFGQQNRLNFQSYSA